MYVNNQQRKAGRSQDTEDDSSIVPMDDETWNAQIVKYANQILMTLPQLDYSSEEVAKRLDQLQKDLCVLLGDEVPCTDDTPCGQDHH